MSKFSKITLGLAVLALTTVPALAGGPSASCGTVSVATSMPVVTRGYTQGVSGLITNCSTGKARYGLEVSVKSSCGVEWCHVSARIPLDGGHSTLYSRSCPVPTNTCVGTSTVTSTLSNGGSTLSTAATTFQVQ